MNTFRNSSLSQNTQLVTAISVSNPDICSTAGRKWRRIKTLRLFAISLQRVSMWPLAGYKNKKMHLHHRLNLRTSAQFSCCISCHQTTCNDLCLGALLNTNCFYRCYNTADIRTSQLVARLLTANCNYGSL
jgi:hypothetical protein